MNYPFTNPPLPYAYDALEPYIDTLTMHLHHDRHLQTYIDNLNAALKNYPAYHSWTLEDLLTNIASLPSSVQLTVARNAGGAYNHIFYFYNLTLPHLSYPTGALIDAIKRQYGSFADFKQQFTDAALSVFGSGYAWLVLDASGHLQIIPLANQDTPLPLRLTPLLNIDVWEHAYYLKHYNLRKDYIADWFQVVHWANANRIYEEFISFL